MSERIVEPIATDLRDAFGGASKQTRRELPGEALSAHEGDYDKVWRARVTVMAQVLEFEAILRDPRPQGDFQRPTQPGGGATRATAAAGVEA